MPQKRSLLYLVNPKRTYRYLWDFKEVCAIMRRRTAVPPLALPTIAAFTPARYDVRIIDEEIEPLDPERIPRPHIVGITAVVSNIRRAYAIADCYRAQGVTVVMGGAQVSFHVEESLEHCSAVVVGEAEGAWERLLADFEQGRLGTRYKADAPPPYKTSPMPRWDLVDTRKVMALPVQVSRGCPYRCDFCLVRNMFGPHQRYRDVDDVVREIRSLPKKQLSFIDDNLTGNKAYAKELMARLKPLKVWWMCQASIEAAYDDELLRDMAEAGCTSILFGIESLNPKALAEIGKKHNDVSRYEEAIRRVHAAGIMVVGAFVVGFDADTAEVFDQVHEFIVRNNLTYVMFNVLTAFPGTDLHERMRRTGRLSLLEPEMCNGIYPTMRYMHLSQVELYERYFATLERIFDYEGVRRRALPVLGNGAFRRFNAGEVGLRDKLVSVVHLLRTYLFSRDPARRRLFLSLVRLGASGRTSMGVVVEFLLFIASFHGYLDYTRAHREEILAKIRAVDKGPWLDDPRATGGEADERAGLQ